MVSSNTASPIFAPVISAPVKSALLKSARNKSVLRKLAPRKLANLKLLRLISAPSKLALAKLPPIASKRMAPMGWLPISKPKRPFFMMALLMFTSPSVPIMRALVRLAPSKLVLLKIGWNMVALVKSALLKLAFSMRAKFK